MLILGIASIITVIILLPILVCLYKKEIYRKAHRHDTNNNSMQML
jgi:hypothetical protein